MGATTTWILGVRHNEIMVLILGCSVCIRGLVSEQLLNMGYENNDELRGLGTGYALAMPRSIQEHRSSDITAPKTQNTSLLVIAADSCKILRFWLPKLSLTAEDASQYISIPIMTRIALEISEMADWNRLKPVLSNRFL